MGLHPLLQAEEMKRMGADVIVVDVGAKVMYSDVFLTQTFD